MSDKNTDKELSLDELKNVSGGGVKSDGEYNEPVAFLKSVNNEVGGWVRKKDEIKNTIAMEDRRAISGASDEDYNDFVQKI